MIGVNVSVRLESTEQVGTYTLFRFADLDAELVCKALRSVSYDLISGRSVLAKRRLSISVTDVKRAVRAMKRNPDPIIKQMADLMKKGTR